MTSSGKTIQIFLPDGNPRGIRIAEITSRTIQVVVAPRANLDIAAQRIDLSHVGVYFLVGSADGENVPLVYVGEAEDCLQRLQKHNRQKDFWQIALVCLSRTHYFTKSHVKYLEWYAYQLIQKASRFKLDNSTEPTRPHISEPVRSDLEDNFETLRILVSALGFPLFDEIQQPGKTEILTCTGKAAQAKGRYTEDGLVVFKGSLANHDEADSAKGTWVSHIREALIHSGTLVDEGKVYRFAKDHVFSSPSAAAVAVLARNANGWTEWKYSDGRTLDKVKRKGD
jgi:hypothetical protein